jgi:hypothetical protein
MTRLMLGKPFENTAVGLAGRRQRRKQPSLVNLRVKERDEVEVAMAKLRVRQFSSIGP